CRQHCVATQFVWLALIHCRYSFCLFFFHDTATTEIYTLSLHDALPICLNGLRAHQIARMGMVRTFQLTKALSRLRVIENMRLGAPRQVGENFLMGLIPALWRKQEEEITERADALLARFRLDQIGRAHV